MNKFVLAFPINVSAQDPFQITEFVQVTADTKTLIIPGCSVQFDVVRAGATAGLSEIFNEHKEISAEDAKAIDGHKSLLFLLGQVKTADDLRMVNVAILKMFTAGAMGVYMQQSGTAWTAADFREELDDAEFPMDPWINFVEGSDTLYTLGLESFGLPDLCISSNVLDGTTLAGEALRDILGVVADSIFVDGISAKSGSEVDGGDAGSFFLRAEAKSPFPKDSPEFNKQGIMRLSKR